MCRRGYTVQPTIMKSRLISDLWCAACLIEYNIGSKWPLMTVYTHNAAVMQGSICRARGMR